MTDIDEDAFEFAADHMVMAEHYGMAASIMFKSGQTDEPFWDAVGHALELSLKGLLLQIGTDYEDLMFSIGHDLQAALSAYIRNAPDSVLISIETIALVGKLSEPYRRNDFRFPSQLSDMERPEAHTALRVLNEHLQSLKPVFYE